MPAACIQPLTPPMRATSGMTRSQALGVERERQVLRPVEVLADLQRQIERAGDRRVAAVVVVADRLFQPRHALRLQCAAAHERLVDRQGLVVVDHQLDVVGQPSGARRA